MLLLLSYSIQHCLIQSCCRTISSVLQDALADRDLVHRQTAATVVQHLALGVAGLSCEDALTHLLNYVWPNVFEDSPHLINGVMGAIDGCRMALGPCIVLHYTLQVNGALGVCRPDAQSETAWSGHLFLTLEVAAGTGLSRCTLVWLHGLLR